MPTQIGHAKRLSISRRVRLLTSLAITDRRAPSGAGVAEQRREFEQPEPVELGNAPDDRSEAYG
jgi:hypothetical protein